MAVKNGSLECLKYARNHGCPWNKEDVSFNAAKYGYVDCLEYVLINGNNWDQKHKKLLLVTAAKNGNFECLKFAFEYGCSWDRKVSYIMVKDRKCRKFLKEKCIE